MKRLLQITAISIIGTFFLLNSANAQKNADITASANIVAELSVNPGDNLSFGDVPLNGSSTVGKLESGNGTVTITGDPNESISVWFSSVPSNLTDGTNDLSISFSASDGGYSNDDDATNSEGTIDPNTNTSSGSSVDFPLSGNGNATILLGGSVNSSGSETVGNTYTGTITVSATYTNI